MPRVPSATPVIERCQDKYDLNVLLRGLGIPAPLTYPIPRTEDIDQIFQRFRANEFLWCRIRRGSGSLAAISVKTPAQARSWIAYWKEMREVPPGLFSSWNIFRDATFACSCLWKAGTLVLVKMAERLSYIGNGSPSGVSSMAALAKTAFEPRLFEVCVQTIRASATIFPAPSSSTSRKAQTGSRELPRSMPAASRA